MKNLYWTRERIRETDWSKKTWAETIMACYEHHKELNEVGIFEGRTGEECPACLKVIKTNKTSYCPLASPEKDFNCEEGDIDCCDGLWLEYDDNPNRETAEAMLKYIKGVLKWLELREREGKNGNDK